MLDCADLRKILIEIHQSDGSIVDMEYIFNIKTGLQVSNVAAQQCPDIEVVKPICVVSCDV